MSVSIVVPLYNSELCAARVLENCLQQTDPDIEIVVIDDASTDSTPEILREYAKREPGIRVFRHDERRGASAARNTGIEHASGEWLEFLDSENLFLPNKTEIMLRCADRETDFLLCDFIMWDSIIDVVACRILGFLSEKKQMLQAMFTSHVGVSTAWMIRKEFFKRIGLFDETMDGAADWEALFRILRFGCSKKIGMPLAIQCLGAPMLSLEREEMRKSLNKAFLKALHSTPPAEILNGDFPSGYEKLADDTLAAWKTRESSEYDFAPTESILAMYGIAYRESRDTEQRLRIESKLSACDASSFLLCEPLPGSMR